MSGGGAKSPGGRHPPFVWHGSSPTFAAPWSDRRVAEAKASIGRPGQDGADQFGMKVPDAFVSAVRLPPVLAANPWLRQCYGTIEWMGRGIYAAQPDWFDGNATDVFPCH